MVQTWDLCDFGVLGDLCFFCLQFLVCLFVCLFSSPKYNGFVPGQKIKFEHTTSNGFANVAHFCISYFLCVPCFFFLFFGNCGVV